VSQFKSHPIYATMYNQYTFEDIECTQQVHNDHKVSQIRSLITFPCRYGCMYATELATLFFCCTIRANSPVHWCEVLLVCTPQRLISTNVIIHPRSCKDPSLECQMPRTWVHDMSMKLLHNYKLVPDKHKALIQIFRRV